MFPAAPKRPYLKQRRLTIYKLKTIFPKGDELTQFNDFYKIAKKEEKLSLKGSLVCYLKLINRGTHAGGRRSISKRIGISLFEIQNILWDLQAGNGAKPVLINNEDIGCAGWVDEDD